MAVGSGKRSVGVGKWGYWAGDRWQLITLRWCKITRFMSRWPLKTENVSLEWADDRCQLITIRRCTLTGVVNTWPLKVDIASLVSADYRWQLTPPRCCSLTGAMSRRPLKVDNASLVWADDRWQLTTGRWCWLLALNYLGPNCWRNKNNEKCGVVNHRFCLFLVWGKGHIT